MEALDLSIFFRTKAQATDFAARLSAIAEKIYQTEFNLENILMEQFGLQKRDKFMTLLRENNVNTGAPSDIKDFFDKLQEKISSLPVLSLTVAFEPKEQTLLALSQWFLLNIDKQVLLDITVNPAIIAGAVISINGKHLDFSVKPKFDQLLNDMVSEKVTQNSPVQKEQPAPTEKHQSISNIHLGR